MPSQPIDARQRLLAATLPFIAAGLATFAAPPCLADAPCWVECPTEPGWWDQLFNCYECSPGYNLGDHCFIYGYAWCGGTKGISQGQAVTLRLQAPIPCVPGGKLSIAYTESNSQSCSCTAGDCETEAVTICYPNSKIKVWKCSKQVPKEWHYAHDGLCREKVVTSWTTKEWYEYEFIPGPGIGGPGTPNNGCGCNTEQTPCFCQRAYDKDCGCDPETEPGAGYAPPNLDPQPLIIAPMPDPWAEWPQQGGEPPVLRSSGVSAALALSDWVVGGPRLNSIDDLSLYQLKALKEIVQNTSSLVDDPAWTMFILEFENTSTMTAMFDDWLTMLDTRIADAQSDPWRGDLDHDGDIDQDDQHLMDFAIARSQQGWAQPSSLDLNGDGIISDADCVTLYNLMLEVEP